MSQHENPTAAPAEAGVPKDPIAQGSLLWPTFLAMIALLVSGAWSLYDEEFTRRQYKNYQNDWVEVAARAYGAKHDAAEKEKKRVMASDEYLALKAAADAAAADADPKIKALTDELNHAISPWLAVLAQPVKEVRSQVTALTYRYEHAKAEGHDAEAQRYFSELTTIKEEVHEILLPGKEKSDHLRYARMTELFADLKKKQGLVQGAMAIANQAKDAANAKVAAYMEAHFRGPTPESISALNKGLSEFIHEIKQIHLQGDDGELIERCESCHVGIRSPIELSITDVGGRREFTSHPRMDLLKTHDPERFGCTPCHNGVGIAVANPKLAHGYYHHSISTMHFAENAEAGCVRCHTNDIHLEGATTFNEGKGLFYQRGCWGCHRYEGFSRESDEEKLLLKSQETVTKRVKSHEIEIDRLKALIDVPGIPDAELEAAFARRTATELQLHLAATEEKQVAESLRQLDLEIKKVGPNLGEAKAKLRPEWIHSWLMDPRAFRPDTKMPRFRVDDEKAWSIAAFLWQSSNAAAVAPVAAGDAEKGENLVITRGCLGCHSVETTEFEKIGKGWAADLSRLGEKANYEYIASWIRDPRTHNKYTVMPSLRLSESDVRDIASWLMTRKKEGAEYGSSAEALAILNDANRLDEGKKLVQHFGCAGCHSIPGLEKEGRVGTELTEEGSKPIERLDFGTQTHDYKHKHDARHPERHGEYDHKGFIENKLANPATWDDGKHITDWFDRLKMPSFFIRKDEPGYAESQPGIAKDIDALTTFLIGSLEHIKPPLGPPERLMYRPTDYRKDLQDGWWVIKKYNCDGCHQIRPGDTPAIWQLPIYEDGKGFEGVPDSNGRPPTLVGEGSRVDPAWLSRFLDDPALTKNPAESHRNGVRQGLAVRMPTFSLSDRERMKLVKFFVAMTRLSPDYVRPMPKPLLGGELELARAAFTAGDCANCHLLGGETKINPNTTFAPTFEPVAERIRPSWVYKWVTTPNAVIPKTAMPAILTDVSTGDTIRWIVNTEKISAAAKGRVGDAMLARLAAYPGDHAELLMRYFAHFDAIEAEYQKGQRAK